MKPATIDISLGEILATLNHSNLPTLIIEGKEDAIVLRPLEKKFVSESLSILPVGGRDMLLQVFLNRGKIGKNKKIIFLCDKDAWCIFGVPDEFISDYLIFTKGYSIENDAIADGEFLSMLSMTEKSNFDAELERFIKWYSLAFSRYVVHGGEVLRCHPNEILDDDVRCDEMLKLNEGEEYPDDIYQIIFADPLMLVRGKSLLALLMRHLSYRGRRPRHNHLALLEQVSVKPGDILQRIYREVGSFLIGSVDRFDSF